MGARDYKLPANSFGYIRFHDGKRVETWDATATTFLDDDKNILRKATLASKLNVKFSVYYQDEKTSQFLLAKHSQTLGACAPYLQGGRRVLIEYTFTPKP